MITIKTMKQIATSSALLGARSCSSLSGLRYAQQERLQRLIGHSQIAKQETRRQWLNGQWQKSR
jgi:hypothetical protein